uniref:Sulfur globule protein CV3 n=1 Tax=Strongyloides papillosus TaxID=174720 RepID=A0A0N5CEY0_STREA
MKTLIYIFAILLLLTSTDARGWGRNWGGGYARTVTYRYWGHNNGFNRGWGGPGYRPFYGGYRPFYGGYRPFYGGYRPYWGNPYWGMPFYG